MSDAWISALLFGAILTVCLGLVVALVIVAQHSNRHQRDAVGQHRRARVAESTVQRLTGINARLMDGGARRPDPVDEHARTTPAWREPEPDGERTEVLRRVVAGADNYNGWPIAGRRKGPRR